MSAPIFNFVFTIFTLLLDRVTIEILIDAKLLTVNLLKDSFQAMVGPSILNGGSAFQVAHCAYKKLAPGEPLFQGGVKDLSAAASILELADIQHEQMEHLIVKQ